MLQPRLTFPLLLLIMLSAVFDPRDPAWSEVSKFKADRALKLDAAPSPESGAPDPLAPKPVDGPAPLAPGAPAAVTGQAPSPLGDADATVVLVRQRLATATPPKGLGGHADLAAVVAYSAAHVQPVWTSKTGFTASLTASQASAR